MMPAWIGSNVEARPKKIATFVDDNGVERGVYEARPVIHAHHKSIYLCVKLDKPKAV